MERRLLGSKLRFKRIPKDGGSMLWWGYIWLFLLVPFYPDDPPNAFIPIFTLLTISYPLDCLIFRSTVFFQLSLLQIYLFTNWTFYQRTYLNGLCLHPPVFMGWPSGETDFLAVFRRIYFNRLFYNQTLLWFDDRLFFINWPFFSNRLFYQLQLTTFFSTDPFTNWHSMRID